MPMSYAIVNTFVYKLIRDIFRIYVYVCIYELTKSAFPCARFRFRIEKEKTFFFCKMTITYTANRI